LSETAIAVPLNTTITTSNETDSRRRETPIPRIPTPAPLNRPSATQSIDGPLAREDAVTREREVEAEDANEPEEDAAEALLDGQQAERGGGDDGHPVDVGPTEAPVAAATLLCDDGTCPGEECEETGSDVVDERRLLKECHTSPTLEGLINGGWACSSGTRA
jgi:hypothetical protein